MLSSKFEYILNDLVEINKENRAICKEFPASDPKRIIYNDQCNSNNFFFQFISALKSNIYKNNFTQNGSNIISNICNKLLFDPNSTHLSSFQKMDFMMLDNLEEKDKNIVDSYLNIFEDGYKLDSDDPQIIKLHLDFLLVPIFFQKIKLDQFSIEYNKFFNNLDKVLGKTRSGGMVFYQDYTRGIENNSNIDEIIKFIQQVKKYSYKQTKTKTNESKKTKKDIDSSKKKLPKGRKKKIPATLKNSVWNNYIGLDVKKDICFCCKSEPITTGNFECGHITAECQGGKTNLQNLRPICGLCNKSMGKKNMYDFMSKCGFS